MVSVRLMFVHITVIRYSGLFLGPPQQTEELWERAPRDFLLSAERFGLSNLSKANCSSTDQASVLL